MSTSESGRRWTLAMLAVGFLVGAAFQFGIARKGDEDFTKLCAQHTEQTRREALCATYKMLEGTGDLKQERAREFLLAEGCTPDGRYEPRRR